MLPALFVVGIASRLSAQQVTTDLTLRDSYDPPAIVDELCLLHVQHFASHQNPDSGSTSDGATSQDAMPAQWGHRLEVRSRVRPGSFAQASTSSARDNLVPAEGWYADDMRNLESAAVTPVTALRPSQRSFGIRASPSSPPHSSTAKSSMLDASGRKEFKHQLSELMAMNSELEEKIKDAQQNATQNATPPTMQEMLPFKVPGWFEPAIFLSLICAAVCCCGICITYCVVHARDGAKEREQGLQTPTMHEELEELSDDCLGFCHSCNPVVMITMMCCSMIFFLCFGGLWKLLVVQEWSAFLTLFGLISSFLLCSLAACFYTWTVSRRKTEAGGLQSIHEISSYVEYLAATQKREAQQTEIHTAREVAKKEQEQAAPKRFGCC